MQVLFPHYLPTPDPQILAWLAKRIRDLRAGRSVEEIARRARLSNVSSLVTIEDGTFHLGLGELRSILQHGYGSSLVDLLGEYSRAEPGALEQRRPFQRDYYYRARRVTSSLDQGAPTPFLSGGDPARYVWATPFRELKGQGMVTEFLELAPAKKRRGKPAGTTALKAHEGEEILHAVHGTVQVFIEDYNPHLSPGECIHFHSTRPHYVRNISATPALLFVVRRVMDR